MDSTLNEPVRMAFDYRGEGKSDIYFAEIDGKIKRWDAVKNEIAEQNRQRARKPKAANGIHR